MSEWPAMRVGRKVGRTLYLMTGDNRDDDQLVGLVDDVQLAAEIADRWNEYGSAYAAG